MNNQSPPFQPAQLIQSATDFIAALQLPNGAIPWFDKGKCDPWDHSEALMALTIASSVSRDFSAPKRALKWLKETQHADGFWYAKYLGDSSDNDKDRKKIDTNFVAYPATALWHFFLVSRDHETLQTFLPMISSAIDYVIAQQHEEGDIQWALSEHEALPADALVTASASILRSLECAIAIAEACGEEKQHWHDAHGKLTLALKHKPWRFDRTWESKARFSMDWFYPILSGALTQNEAKQRIEQSWTRFIHDDLGCKCVDDEPWITIAESCECVMALIAAGKHAQALKIFHQLQQWQDKDGGFWTGYVYRDQTIWPQEKTTWTAGAVVLAADALFNITEASTLFTKPSQVPLTF